MESLREVMRRRISAGRERKDMGVASRVVALMGCTEFCVVEGKSCKMKSRGEIQSCFEGEEG